MYGFPLLDPLGALVVAGIIAKIGTQMTIRSAHHLLDRLTPSQLQTVDQLTQTLRDIPGDRAAPCNALTCAGVDSAAIVRARPFERTIAVEVLLPVGPHMQIQDAFELRRRVKHALLEAAPRLAVRGPDAGADTLGRSQINVFIQPAEAEHDDAEEAHGHSHGGQPCNHSHGSADAGFKPSAWEPEPDTSGKLADPPADEHGHSHDGQPCGHSHSHGHAHDDSAAYLQAIRDYVRQALWQVKNIEEIETVEARA